MALVDTLYDIISGIGGTLFGVAVTTLVNWRRTRRLNQLLTNTQQQVKSIRIENENLLSVVREKENRILELEEMILKKSKRK